VKQTVINAASVFAGEFFVRLVNFFVPILIARTYDSSALGKYSFGLACATLAALVPDFGLHLLTTREVASRPEKLGDYFWNVQTLKIVLTLVAFALIFLLSWSYIPDAETRWIVWILSLRMLLQSASYFFMAIIKAFERMHYLVLLQVANFSIVFVGLGLGFHLQWRLTAVLCAFLPGVVCEALLGCILVVRKFGHIGFIWPSWRRIRSISAQAFPIGLTAILITLNLRLDVIVLSRLRPAADVGLFSAANILSAGVFLLASLVISVIFPKMSRLASQSLIDFRDYMQTLLKLSLFFLMPVATVIFFAAAPIIQQLYGSRYSASVPVLKILAFSVPLIFINAVFFYAFVAQRRRSSYLWVMASGVAMNLLVNPVLSWWLGLEGTALSNLLREACLLLLFVGLSLEEQSPLTSTRVLIHSCGSLLGPMLLGLGLMQLGFGGMKVLGVVLMFYLLITAALNNFPKKRELLMLAR
jgi:PST family polysaccharide transporter